MWDSYPPWLNGVFELVMTAFHCHLKPTIRNHKSITSRLRIALPFSVFITHCKMAMRFFVHTRHTNEKARLTSKRARVARSLQGANRLSQQTNVSFCGQRRDGRQAAKKDWRRVADRHPPLPESADHSPLPMLCAPYAKTSDSRPPAPCATTAAQPRSGLHQPAPLHN